MLWCARIEALGRVAELVDAADLKSADSNIVRVQVPPRPPDIILKICLSLIFWLVGFL